MSRRRSTWGALGLAVVVVALVVLLERYGPAPTEGPEVAATAEMTDGPVAGSWVCATGDGRDGTSLDTLLARPAEIGAGPASVDLARFQEGEATTTSLPAVFPPSHAAESVDVDGDDVATWARWSGGPVAVSREWRWDGADDLPDATVAGPCAQPFSSRWTIPGMATSGGHDARLRLANPFRTDATVAVHFVTPEGVRAPIALQNWTVPARSVREINVNEVLPEQDDLAAVVDVAAGRLSVEGFQITRAEIGGVDGGSLLAAAPAAAETWTVPWVADDDTTTSWLWIVNTGDRTAPVELTLHSPDGGDVPEGLAEVSVPPGELRRVELGGTLPEDVEVASVTARSDGAPVVVSAAARVTAPVDDDAPDPEDPDDLDPDDPDPDDPDPDDPDDPEPDDPEELDEIDLDQLEEQLAEEIDAAATGFAVQLGVPALDPSWSVSGGSLEGRQESLRLTNPSGDNALVDIALFDGSQLVEPEELQGLSLPAGSAVSVSVSDHLGDVGSWTAFVDATEGELAVGRAGRSGDGPLHLVAVPGIPSAAAAPRGDVLAGIETSGLVYRLGTSLGLEDADPFDVPRDAPDPAAPDVPDPDGLLDDEPLPGVDDELDGENDPDADPGFDVEDDLDDLGEQDELPGGEDDETEQEADEGDAAGP